MASDFLSNFESWDRREILVIFYIHLYLAILPSQARQNLPKS